MSVTKECRGERPLETSELDSSECDFRCGDIGDGMVWKRLQPYKTYDELLDAILFSRVQN